MKSLTRWLFPLLAILMLLLMVAWMAGVFNDAIEPGLQPQPVVTAKGGVPVEAQTIELFEAVPASVEAKQATLISSRLLARIVNVHVRAGDSVEEGQLLVELEQSDLLSRVSQARANVQSASARLTEARQALNRAQTLRDRGILAQADLDKAQANHDTLVAGLDSAQQGLQAAQAALDYASVRAPIQGRIVDRFAEPGDTVQPGMKLLSLYNPNSLRVEANVREALALTLTLGQALTVTIPALNKEMTAVIEELVPAGNPGSRSFLVKSRLEQGAGLLPGMYARVKVPAGEADILLIPAERVAQVGQLDLVWVAGEQGVERRYVRLGKTYPQGKVEVMSGLLPGDQVLSVQTQ
ncbi:efflux RND transporter periplasmic adaptor subunit [Aestuariicella hydrocarbonica]|uniref:Efflux RND transporter periplasmic adaptor subunit n=1 Tax=Pseudomaricurvus hydrocarbonicus TaxID=1470433 RepID=A0A9E5T3Q5_9GAMM|nr:efflux RND transporter periplasmic adaptor subunit [Aestuariicella hydrocarbonica]NHO67204.1 efflux RND transporter periplasmic adaptor subunit [Aestuariicella hydrocarbonica]